MGLFVESSVYRFLEATFDVLKSMEVLERGAPEQNIRVLEASFGCPNSRAYHLFYSRFDLVGLGSGLGLL